MLRIPLPLVLAPALGSLAAGQTTWYVDVNGSPPGSGTLNDPYTSIQYAIDQPTTLDADRIEVFPGTYLETVDYSGKTLYVVSREGAAATVVDAGYQGTAVRAAGGEGPATWLVGFTVRHGEALQPADFGSAVRLVGSSLSLKECAVVSNGDRNQSVPVAGIYVEDGQLLLLESEVSGNGAHDQFGAAGVHVVGASSFVKILDCELADNRGGLGGALYLGGGTLLLERTRLEGNATNNEAGAGMYVDGANVTAIDCEFVENVNHFDSYPGGAIYQLDGTLSVVACHFEGNQGNRGGAIAVDGGTADVVGSTFLQNSASTSGVSYGSGGAIAGNLQTTVRRSVFRWNGAWGGCGCAGEGEGGAILGAGLVEHCTFWENFATASGGAVQSGQVRNSVVWNNTPDQLGPFASATYSAVQGGSPGQGNIASDPQLVDPDYPDLHLRQGSPCIDAGDPNSAPDPDGSVADMGAFPFDADYFPEPQLYCAPKVNSLGCAPRIGWTGGPTLSGPDDFVIRATQVLGGQFGLMIWGLAPADQPLFGGTLCVAQPFVRTPVTNSGGTGGGVDCSGTLAFHFSQAYMAAKSVPAYETLHAQWWYRDNGFSPPDNVGLSGGLKFLVVP